MRKKIILTVMIVLTSLSLSVAINSVHAHERRFVTIDGAVTRWVVGWSVEPALVDQFNGVSLSVINNATEAPITGLESLLVVEVTTGPISTELRLDDRFGSPGEYDADLIPTVPGRYVFRFFGIVNGTSINQTFDCNDGRFDCVEASSAAQFPVVTLSLRDLSSRLDQALLLATVIGGAGVAVGAAGILIGIVAYRRKPRTQA